MLRAEEKASSKTTAKAAPADKPKKATKTAAVAKPAKATASKGNGSKPKKAKGLDAELRHQLINETAHFLAEKRCCGASETDDWLFAEKLVDGVSNALQ